MDIAARAEDGGRRTWIPGWLMDLAAAGGLLLVVAGLQVRWSPRFINLESDSGLFAYGGQQILRGALLYRDIFDTKPPAVFYVNALAQSLGGETRWPIWVLSGIWIAATIVVLFLLVRSLTGRAAAFAACSLLLVVLHDNAIYQGGNFTEIYALLPQVLIVSATLLYFRSGRRVLVVLVGALAALAFLFKPTYIVLATVALGLIIAAPAAKRRWNEAVAGLALFLAGVALVLVPVGLYWAAQGALADMLYQIFAYGTDYIRGGLSPRSLYVTLRKLAETAPMAYLMMLTLAGMLISGWEFVKSRAQARANGEGLWWAKEPSGLILAGVVLAVPMEWAMAALSGQNFSHYFITPLPAMSIMAALALHRAWSAAPGGLEAGPWRFAFGWLATAILGLGLVLGIVSELPERYQLNMLLARPYGGETQVSPLVGYLEQNTQAEETVLVWGNEPGINFLANRRAPSRYLFATQLLLSDGHAAERLEEFLEDLRRNPPRLLAQEVAPEIRLPLPAGAEGEECDKCPPEAEAAWARLRQFIAENYAFAANVADWTVYRRADGLDGE